MLSRRMAQGGTAVVVEAGVVGSAMLDDLVMRSRVGSGCWSAVVVTKPAMPHISTQCSRRWHVSRAWLTKWHCLWENEYGNWRSGMRTDSAKPGLNRGGASHDRKLVWQSLQRRRNLRGHSLSSLTGLGSICSFHTPLTTA